MSPMLSPTTSARPTMPSATTTPVTPPPTTPSATHTRLSAISPSVTTPPTTHQMLLMMPDDQSRKLPMITMARPHSRRLSTPMKSQTQLIKPPLVSFPVASTVLVPMPPLGTLLVAGPVAMVRSRLVKSRSFVAPEPSLKSHPNVPMLTHVLTMP